MSKGHFYGEEFDWLKQALGCKQETKNSPIVLTIGENYVGCFVVSPSFHRVDFILRDQHIEVEFTSGYFAERIAKLNTPFKPTPRRQIYTWNPLCLDEIKQVVTVLDTFGREPVS